MFNYYLKSRDKSEIQKRVDTLVKLLEKEVKINLYKFSLDQKIGIPDEIELGKKRKADVNLSEYQDINK